MLRQHCKKSIFIMPKGVPIKKVNRRETVLKSLGLDFLLKLKKK